MAGLEGHAAFAALEALLAGEMRTDWSAKSQTIERLRIALTEEPQAASPLDIALLLRQALIHEFGRREHAISPTVVLRHPRLVGFEQWRRIGIDARADADRFSVRAVPWSPAWLETRGPEGVDGRASSESRCRFFDSEPVDGDPLLNSVGREAYRSPGQRAAVRSALSTPAGGTIVVALPTGEGKSLVFQLAHTVGFVGSRPVEGKGVTLVIVPTVALGVNHEIEAVAICNLTPPLAYQGGDDARNAQIAQRIADGTQGLCFASPEAACGALRSSLKKAAESGYLRAMVIDEAHLVDQWGTGFRTEFQELSGVRRELMSVMAPEHRMRTILLSATLTESSLETLKLFFGGDENFVSFAAVQLRPEPDYWIARRTHVEERVERVFEAMHHVPRPAVLYVTEVKDADAWYVRLREAGFGRVAKLHGQTRRDDREKIVDQWRNGALDVVVGTSAFGLGIDYAHARSVVHACIPETLDRFYQEVGRGGRDGCASLSLIVPAHSDLPSAQRINRESIIGISRGLERWTSMFENKVALPGGRYAVRADGRPGTSPEDIDMFGDRNTDWNLRTLALMSRARILNMRGSPGHRLADEGDWLEIEILEEGHLERDIWDELVQPVRAASAEARDRNLRLMEVFLSGEDCPATVLAKLYGKDRIGIECSRCHVCRRDPDLRQRTVHVGEPRSPWPSLPMHPDLVRLLGGDGRLLVTYDPDAVGRKTNRHLADSVEKLSAIGLVKLLVLGSSPFDLDRVLQFAERTPFFVSRLDSLVYSRLPRGPEIVLVAPGSHLHEVNLIANRDFPRVFVAPERQMSFDGRRLADVFGGRVLGLDHFSAKVTE
ncbi:protein DpdF [Bradyrhizobium sp. HKCCYLRH3061]|uniref:protein DpdF n=1 Tax=Bradyrhizobium sp. HKCCYLRH3061 TaxID=3420734 RepID=UPI003EB8D331